MTTTHRIQAHFGGLMCWRQQLATLCQQIDFDLTDVWIHPRQCRGSLLLGIHLRLHVSQGPAVPMRRCRATDCSASCNSSFMRSRWS